MSCIRRLILIMRARGKQAIVATILFQIIITLIIFQHGSKLTFMPNWLSSSQRYLLGGNKNYEGQLRNMSISGLLINTTKCRILSLDLWNKDALDERRNYRNLALYKCTQKPRITYIDENKLIVSEDALNKLNLSFNTVSCCYNTIQRVEQTPLNYDLEADSKFGLSQDCEPLNETATRIKSRFIFVSCRTRPGQQFYSNFHAVPLFPPDEETASGVNKTGGSKSLLDSYWKSNYALKKKTDLWRRCQINETMNKKERGICWRFWKEGPLPHVLIIGIDSTSRSNFRRFMNRTVATLEGIGAVEMKGFTKVGQNTLPNILPFLTSFTLPEILSTCLKNSFNTSFDECPFLWKDFSSQNYVTAFLEDAPRLSNFNHMLTGFVNQPTDFYFRPFTLAAYKFHEGMKFDHGAFVDCIGYERPEEMIFNFVLRLMQSSHLKHTPTFTFTWLTDLTHRKANTISFMDGKLSDMISQLEKNGIMDNSLVFVMGDHGYRTDTFRVTLTGWLEDKLPTLWVHLPKRYREQYKFQEALQHNSRQLITMFDLHATLKHVLHINKMTQVNSVFRVNRGISIFTKKIPDRSCKEANIPVEFCPCNMEPSLIDPKFVEAAARFVEKHFSTFLPSTCSPLYFDKVLDAGIIFNSNFGERKISGTGDTLILISQFYGIGEGVLVVESGIEYDHLGFQNVTHHFKTNRFGSASKSKCINENDPMQPFCICKDKKVLRKEE